MICAFFGHRNSGLDSEECLLEEIEKLIVLSGVDCFYVGNKGRFDRSVHFALKKMKWKYPHIKTYIVLDSVTPPSPNKLSLDKKEYMHWIKCFDLLVPEGIETVPKRFAMCYRNDWMIEECDIAVIYYLYPGTNTQKHIDKLMRKGKTIINIADINSNNETEY